MSFTSDDVKKIAHLARLTLSDSEAGLYTKQLSNILSLVKQMETIDTGEVIAMAHPLDITQRLRQDKVTEVNQRELFQSIAPQVEAGLYLVPKVIEEGE